MNVLKKSLAIICLPLLTKAQTMDCSKIYLTNTANEIRSYDPVGLTTSGPLFISPFGTAALGYDPVKGNFVMVSGATNANADIYTYNLATNVGATFLGAAPNPGINSYNRLCFAPGTSIAYLMNLNNDKFVRIDFTGTTPVSTTMTAIGAPPITSSDYRGGDIVMRTKTLGYLLTSGFTTGQKFFYSFTISGNTITFTLLGNTTVAGSCASIAWDPAGSGNIFFNSGTNVYKFLYTTTGTFTSTLHQTAFTSIGLTDFTSTEPPSTAIASADQIVCNASPIFTVTGNNPTKGSSGWSIVSGSGSITGSTTSTLTTVSVAAGNTLTIRYSVTNCSQSFDNIVISNGATPTTANAGISTTLCTTSYTANGNIPLVGTGIWTKISGGGTVVSPTNPKSVFTGLTNGSNVFKWEITSGSCPPSSGFLTLTLVNCPPTAVNDNASTSLNTAVTSSVNLNDFDSNTSQTLTYAVTNPPANGSVVMNPNGSYTFTPNTGFSGTTTFTYQVCDNGSPILCSNAVVTIVVSSGSLDNDGDGIPDSTDVDDDNDGILDIAEGTGDKDGDGVPNQFDLDSDNDGIFDIAEVGGSDPDNNGIVGTGVPTVGSNGLPTALSGNALPNVDTDGDGTPNINDLDSDNDGIFDIVENGKGALDTDLNGVLNGTDTDGDGIINLPGVDTNSTFGGTGTAPLNFDGDTKPNFLDLDSDNDGILDVVESGNGALDTNNNGIVDGTDTDGDGIINVPTIDPNSTFGGTATTPLNTDGSGNPNYLDIDADNDGIVDNIEGQTTIGYISPANADTDGDGIDNAYDTFNGFGGQGVTPTNTDFADLPDYLDLDSDNDGNTDIIEGWDLNGDDVIGSGETAPSNLDSDNDGLDNAFDNNDAAVNPSNGQTPNSFPNVEGGTSELDWRDTGSLDHDGDGIPNSTDVDDDNDGILDTVEGTGDKDGDGVPNMFDLDSDNDGIFDVTEAGGSDPDNNGLIGTGVPPVSANGLPTSLGGSPLTNVDFDGDGVPNSLDLDSDNDGILDVVEAGYGALDTNNNGVVDGTDTDNDGIINVSAIDPNTSFGGQSTAPTNTDANGNPNFIDIDADNDGIVDNIEGQTTTGYVAPTGVDTDGDGIDNTYDSTVGFGGSGITPTNTDGIDTPDYIDLDSDNDGNPDIIEGWDLNGNDVIGSGEISPSGLDNDNDGLDNAFDNNDVAVNPSNGQTPASFPNVEAGTSQPDWRDPEYPDNDNDGVPNSTDLDDDNDGILDITEGSGDEDGDGIPNQYDLDSDNDGISDVLEGGSPDTNNDGTVDNFLDNNNDGVDDAVTVAPGFPGLNVPDTDSDGKPDYLDIDSDDDGLFDVTEGGSPDNNGDGLVDNYTDADGNGWDDTVENGTGLAGPPVPDTDGNGIPDYQQLDESSLNIPEGFSPNNDGVNDLFVIRGITAFPKNKFTVFNRWGNEVYSKEGYDNSWTGISTKGVRIGGDELPEATYFYILDLGNDTKPKTGFIYLSR